MKLKKLITLVFIFEVLCHGPLFSLRANDEIGLKWNDNIYKLIYRYKKLHHSFFKKVCSNGADHQYYKLLSEYRGEGRYLPMIDQSVDKNAMKKGLKYFDQKIKFINKSIQTLSQKDFQLEPYEPIKAKIESLVNELLVLKKNHAQALLENKKNELQLQSKEKLQELKKVYAQLIDKIFYLKSFGFPNDHLKNRRDYEHYRYNHAGIEKRKSRLKANEIYFYRKIVEDGAIDPDTKRNDGHVRAIIDYIYYQLESSQYLLDENLRYDLEWLLKKLEHYTYEKTEDALAKLMAWLEDTKKTKEFYEDLLKSKNKKKLKEIIENKNAATIQLQEYVYKKQVETYQWWMKQDEIYRALFAMETILFNEVGPLDNEQGSERKDVAQVILNRVKHPVYSKLDTTQALYKVLLEEHKNKNKLHKDQDKDLEAQVQAYRWLNTLFRVGEFSFTYYYISAVAKVFCPDMSSRGKALREENLKISLKAIRNYSPDFNIIRYFSRVSMFARLDMSTVWKGYRPYPERPGLEIYHSQRYLRFYLADKYQYHYSFQGPKGASYQVLSFGDETLVMTWVKGRVKFYEYRDPQLFRYFVKDTVLASDDESQPTSDQEN